TIVYTNNGPSDVNNVVITDTLDGKVFFLGIVNEDPVMDGFDQNGQILTWTKSLLTSGTSGEIVFEVTVQPDSEGVITNSVQIKASEADPVPENNLDQINTSIGDPTKATIYGYVFEDNNGNGIKENGEPGIPGVVVTMDQAITATTDAGGLYFFTTSVSGTHIVVESQPSGYFSTTPDEVHLAVMLGESYRVDFGEAADDAGFAAIFGTVFEDSDSDGTWDISETGIDNVTVTLNYSGTKITDLYGRFTFSTTLTGDHLVVETDPEYYFSTTPNTVTVVVEMNNGYEVNYGDVRADLASCPADPFEEDDEYAQAKELPTGSVQKHDFCDDAVDWMKISVDAGNTYTITTSSWGQRADTFLALFDIDGQTMLAANDDYAGTGDYSSRLVWKATATGEYFVRTTNRTNLEGFHTDYDIWVEEEKVYSLFLPIIFKNQGPTAGFGQPALFSMANMEQSFVVPDDPESPTGEIVHACPDAYEIDDTWQQANSIESGEVQLHWFDSDPVLYAADKDFVSFDLKTGQEITFTVTSTKTEVLLELYDATGNFMGLSGLDSLKIMNVQAGQYFLSASPNDPISGCQGETGYELFAEKSAQYGLYFPIIIKN
ncbi:MAG: SdrD B-like domain-containing protein, partial [Chloroflexota bacterium]